MVSFKVLFFLLIFLAVLFEIVADVLFKKWSMESKTFLFVVGIVLYAIGTVFWAFSLKYEFLSRAIIVFTVVNLVVISLVGVIFFKESLSLVNKVGIFAGLLSVVLVEW
ncbi:MAG TPA: SMR family transporter [Candidatus Nanoarchaeia archaeon]|nr:SMR family transporter [Candidatus Nanoarchaeia archaeon]